MGDRGVSRGKCGWCRPWSGGAGGVGPAGGGSHARHPTASHCPRPRDRLAPGCCVDVAVARSVTSLGCGEAPSLALASGSR